MTQPNKADFRKDGSSDNLYAYGEQWYDLPASSIFYLVGLDDSQVFETKIEASAINIYALGYTEPASASDWSYRKPINITNTGNALTDYQVKVHITDTSKMSDNGADLRFTNEANTVILRTATT